MPNVESCGFKGKRSFCERALAGEPPSYPLAHHPPCARLKNHTFYLGRYRLCIGCYIGYPSAIIGIGVASGLYLGQVIALSGLLIIGLAGYLSLLVSLTRSSEKHRVKMIQKASIGGGSGFLIAFGFFVFDTSFFLRIGIGMLLVFGLIIPVRAFHMRKVRRTCESCDDRGIDPACTDRNEGKNDLLDHC